MKEIEEMTLPELEQYKAKLNRIIIDSERELKRVNNLIILASINPNQTNLFDDDCI